jgi:hypothetical protein
MPTTMSFVNARNIKMSIKSPNPRALGRLAVFNLLALAEIGALVFVICLFNKFWFFHYNTKVVL